MRKFGWLTLALVAIAAPAQAQVIIEEAPGSQGASMEPTFYLNTETARILPDGLQYVSIAGGTLIAQNTASLEYNRGMGAGGELEATIAGLWYTSMGATSSGFGSRTTFYPDAALGYKQRVAVLGGWDAAVNGKAFYQSPNSLPSYGVQLGAPFTTLWGPGDLTLEPRAFLPDLAHGLNASTYGLTAAYRLPLGTQWRLLFEASGGYHSSGYPAYEGRCGVRYMPLPTFCIDAGLGLDVLGLSDDVARPESADIANLAVRFGF